MSGDGKLAKEWDVVPANGEALVLQAECYQDRSFEKLGFELSWTNGNHLTWKNKRPPDPHPYAANNWFAVNHKVLAPGKWEEWHPQAADEIPFAYFERLEFEVAGPYPVENALWTPVFAAFLNGGPSADLFRAFLPKAFRRPIAEEELLPYVNLVDQRLAQGAGRLEALKLGLTAVLCSPDFLFLVEKAPADAAIGAYQLDDFELANRLSYFLWSSQPDQALFDAAGQAKLGDPNELRAQVTRMLADRRAAAFAESFARQWLGLDRLSSAMPEPKLFPGYSEDLRDASRAESVLCFQEAVVNNLPVAELISANWTYANEKLAEHYGLPALPGRALRKIQLADSRRGGILTQSAILTLTSEATRTSPVRRGAYVLERVFNRPPPPPPPGVAGLIPDASQAKSVKEHLEIHRAHPACAGCHAKFDPFGMVLENYDATGAWRDEETAHEDPSKPIERPDGEALPKFTIDSTSVLRDGNTRISGIQGLKHYLAEHQEEFARGLTEQFMVYALGRGLRVADQPAIDAILEATRKENFKMQAMLTEVVLSQPFRTR